jgi:hypothetical protein
MFVILKVIIYFCIKLVLIKKPLTIMKKAILSVLFICAIVSAGLAQKTYKFPSNDPLIKIPLSTDKWILEDSDGTLIISPKGDDSGNFFCMIWTTDNPSSETAIDDLATEVTELAAALLADLTWAEDVSDFENNGISFVGMDGEGYYVADDGSETKFMCSVMLLLPDGESCVALVFFSASDLYSTYENDFLELVLGIKTAK